jgi:predicted phage terminase large subunit-like protein
MYADNPRVKAISVPDIDPETGESNFDYEYGGFTKEFFADQELLMDDISYKCLYKQQPIEREGLLYHEDELRRYMSLPLREPDAILGICDVKNKGTDFMFLPCCYQYDDDYYLVDCVCDDNADYGVQYGRLTNLIVEHNMQQCEFESNNGGDRVSFEVGKRVADMGGRCNITEKATETNKETRILVNADWVKKHILFKDKSLYKPKSDYGIMMEWLLRYSLVGKNPHDDVPDGLANFALFVTRKDKRRETRIMQNMM